MDDRELGYGPFSRWPSMMRQKVEMGVSSKPTPRHFGRENPSRIGSVPDLLINSRDISKIRRSTLLPVEPCQKGGRGKEHILPVGTNIGMSCYPRPIPFLLSILLPKVAVVSG